MSTTLLWGCGSAVCRISTLSPTWTSAPSIMNQQTLPCGETYPVRNGIHSKAGRVLNNQYLKVKCKYRWPFINSSILALVVRPLTAKMIPKLCTADPYSSPLVQRQRSVIGIYNQSKFAFPLPRASAQKPKFASTSNLHFGPTVLFKRLRTL